MGTGGVASLILTLALGGRHWLCACSICCNLMEIGNKDNVMDVMDINYKHRDWFPYHSEQGK